MAIPCSVCGSRNSQPSVTYGPIPLCDAYAADRASAAAVRAYNVDAVTCRDCGHSELAEKPPEDEIYANYKYFSSNSPDLDEHFAGYASWIMDRLKLQPGATHMDVGCNDGMLLGKTQALGLRSMGIDPSPAAAHAAAKGLDVFHGYLNEEVVSQRELDGVADVVSCNNVLANVRDLIGFGRCIDRMLKKDGAFVVETLHYPTLLRNRVFEMINHEHYHYFSVGSIGRYFSRLGLELVSCEHVATKGANMRCVARKVGRSGHGEPAKIDPLLSGTEAHIAMEAFTRTLEDTRVSIRSMIDQARSRGPIAGFGSSAGTTILMYLLGIPDQLDYLVDDNPSRHGFFAPGSGLPVISPADYYRSNPGLTIIFAWRFAEQIAKKHRQNLASTHDFILANTATAV
jgi:2-polyprenyl-3-methyl-5-hydroxy-6-metoxy-1,4-benzoquinol methylase